MNEERKFDKYVREHDKAHREQLLQEVMLAHPELASNKRKNPSKPKMKRLAWILPLTTVAVCAAVIIPSVLLTHGGNVDNGDDSRYSGTLISDYSGSYFESIKAYNEQNGTSICYFNWYDVSETEGAIVYTENGTGRFLGIDEEMYNLDKDIVAYVLAVDVNIQPISPENKYNEYCIENQYVNDLKILWGKAPDSLYCTTFIYNDYRYILTADVHDENNLFALIEELVFS